MKLRKNTITIELSKTQDRDLAQMRCQEELTTLKRAIFFGETPVYFLGDTQDWEKLKEKVYDTEVVSIDELVKNIDDIDYYSRGGISPHQIKDYILEMLEENDYNLNNHMMLTVGQLAEIMDVGPYSSDDLYKLIDSTDLGALERALGRDGIVENHVKIFQVNGYSQGDFAHVFVPAHLVKNDQDERNIGDYLQKLLFDCPCLFKFTVTLAGVEQEFDFFAREIDAVFDEYDKNGIRDDVVFKEVNTYLNENGFDSLSQNEKEQLSEYFKSIDVDFD